MVYLTRANWKIFNYVINPQRGKWLQINEGRAFEAPFEAVLGARMAAMTGLKVGDTFKTSHGMVEIPGSEVTLNADLVLIAAGFLGSEAYVTDAFGVACTPRTNVATETDHYKTNVEKVFTAGDMHRGQSLVVWAIREGREAAKEVDQYLMGYTKLR